MKTLTLQKKEFQKEEKLKLSLFGLKVILRLLRPLVDGLGVCSTHS